MRLSLRRVGALLVTGGVLAGCTTGQGGASSAATPPGETQQPMASPTGGAQQSGLDAVCGAARDEGAVVLWSPGDTEIEQAFFDVFAESHPGIELQHHSIRPEEGGQRLISEHAAGQPTTVDMVSFITQTLVPLVERDLVRVDIDWASLSVPSELVSDNNASVLWYRKAQGITYNTNLVSEEELPDTWDGLLEPEWGGGKVVVDPRGKPFDTLSLVWGEEQALEYVRRLKANGPTIIEGGTAGMVAVASEEAVLTTGGLSVETKEQQARGAPLEIKYLDVIPTQDSVLAVLQDAPHPNAALCYASWLVSEEGQQAVFEINYGGHTPSGLPEGSQILSIDTPEQAEQVAEVAGKMVEIWTGG